MSDSSDENNSRENSDISDDEEVYVKKPITTSKLPMNTLVAGKNTIKKIEKEENESDEEEEEDDIAEDDEYVNKVEEDDDANINSDADDEDEDSEEDGDEDDEDPMKKKKTTKKTDSTKPSSVLENMIKNNVVIPDYDTDDDEMDEKYLQKFDTEMNQNYLMKFHPECMIHNYDEIAVSTKIIKDNNGIIIDPLHRTAPYLTKYEKARVLGQRAKQIEHGAKPFVKVPENVIDGYLIAELELKEKKIPFIIRRPLPNGTSEYWKLSDLDLIYF